MLSEPGQKSSAQRPLRRPTGVAERFRRFADRFKRDAISNNVAWVQLLGLCPLLAVSNSIDNALGLAAASAFVLVGSSIVVSSIRRWISDEYRLPCFVLVIATFTTVVTLVMEAFAFELYIRVALFVQIIVTNCMILGRIEQSASKVGVGTAIIDASVTAFGFAIALVALGATRQVLGTVIPLAVLPAGAFIIAGLLIALGRAIFGAPSR